MNILVNCATLKKGGGQNVALNFLYHVLQTPPKDITLVFLVAEDSALKPVLEKSGQFAYYIAPSNPLSRIKFELSQSQDMLKKHSIDVIYSYFGYGFFPKRYPQVAGVAVSNIFTPGVKFWEGYPPIQRLKKWAIDMFRLFSIRRADGLIFENTALATQARNMMPKKQITTIKPSIVIDDSKSHTAPMLDKSNPDKKYGLFLCGWHRNKNVQLIPEIASKLKTLGVDFDFVITATVDDSPLCQSFLAAQKRYAVADRIHLIGPQDKSVLPQLYHDVDLVFLLSKLESFSNNIIEAWSFSRPLVTTDAAWSRAIMGEAALYVSRDNADDIALKIQSILNDDTAAEYLVKLGQAQLTLFPTIAEKSALEFEFIKDIYKRSRAKPE